MPSTVGRWATGARSGTPTTAASSGSRKTRASPARCGPSASSTSRSAGRRAGSPIPTPTPAPACCWPRATAARPGRRVPKLDAAGPAAAGLFRPAARLGDRLPLGHVSVRRVCHRRWRAELAAAAGRRRGRLAGRPTSSTRAPARWPAATVSLAIVRGGQIEAADDRRPRPAEPRPTAAGAVGRRLAGGRRRPGARPRPTRARRGSAPPGELPPARAAVRFCRPGRSRAEMLDRRHARHARLPHGRRRPHLDRLAHRLDRAAAGHRLRRRPARLGGRRLGHDPGHHRRRADLAAAAGRQHAGPPCWASSPTRTTCRWN